MGAEVRGEESREGRGRGTGGKEVERGEERGGRGRTFF